MITWDVRNLVLKNEVDTYLSGDTRKSVMGYTFAWEQRATEIEKIQFVDSIQDGGLSKTLEIIDKFVIDRQHLPQDKDGEIRTASLTAWLKRNDKDNLVVKTNYDCGRLKITNHSPRFCTNCCVLSNYTVLNRPALVSNLIEQAFHAQLLDCLQQEREYYRKHDPMTTMRGEFIKNLEGYGAVTNTPISYDSHGNVFVCKDWDGNEKRPISKQELEYLLRRYVQLDAMLKAFREETVIAY